MIPVPHQRLAMLLNPCQQFQCLLSRQHALDNGTRLDFDDNLASLKPDVEMWRIVFGVLHPNFHPVKRSFVNLWWHVFILLAASCLAPRVRLAPPRETRIVYQKLHRCSHCLAAARFRSADIRMNTAPLDVSLHFCSPSTATAISPGQSDRVFWIFRETIFGNKLLPHASE